MSQILIECPKCLNETYDLAVACCSCCNHTMSDEEQDQRAELLEETVDRLHDQTAELQEVKIGEEVTLPDPIFDPEEVNEAAQFFNSAVDRLRSQAIIEVLLGIINGGGPKKRPTKDQLKKAIEDQISKHIGTQTEMEIWPATKTGDPTEGGRAILVVKIANHGKVVPIAEIIPASSMVEDYNSAYAIKVNKKSSNQLDSK